MKVSLHLWLHQDLLKSLHNKTTTKLLLVGLDYSFICRSGPRGAMYLYPAPGPEVGLEGLSLPFELCCPRLVWSR